jgi:hypothetical protein
MGKSRRSVPFAASASAKPTKHNPFEIVKGRSRFETIGRRVSTTSHNVTQARSDAVDKVRILTVGAMRAYVTVCVSAVQPGPVGLGGGTTILRKLQRGP